MPRRKRAFIQRSTAHTYHVIRDPTSDNPDRHVLVSDPSAQSDINANSPVIDNELDQTYSARDYEVGEFGFPEDGYDYLKHFRTIGGGGGVFMSAATGLPDPDAVRQTLSNVKKTKPSQPLSSKDVVVLKEPDDPDGEEDKTENPKTVNQRLDEQASLLRQQALDEIHRDRKYDADLSQVLVELDGEELLSEHDTDFEAEEQLSVGEDDLDASEEFFGLERNNPHDMHETAPSSDGADPDPYFNKLLLGDSEDENEAADDRPGPAVKHELEGISEKYREPRLLDKQFDSFMQGFEADDSDSETDEELRELRQQAENETENDTKAEDIFALLNENEKEGLMNNGEGFDVRNDNYDSLLLDEFSELKIWDTTVQNEEIVDGEEFAPSEKASKREVENDAEELEGYRQAEFEKGMEGVLDSFARIPASEALRPTEALGNVQGAVERHKEQESSRLERLEKEGRLNEDGQSDGNDSELDTLFDEQFDRPAEQWDCETIISTYSNVENHPSIIDAPCRTMKPRSSSSKQSVIRLDPRTQAPAEFMAARAGIGTGGASSARREVNFGSRAVPFAEAASGSSNRDKEESKEDKKRRKARVKELARQRRAMKSEMKKAFGAESVKQNKHSAALGNAKVAVQF